ncbi:DUF1232 domain-containing protein [Saccharopolyspora sp. HNM0983]|uniref:DUF1232 domain-containing protein n=1 Tax=Saccharopolyspora montiporae TaxID=2781240 RepID=A0A929G1I1_9PSEU|nr:DUF1232 domain-containing protein [Saccharopolyspora sp. HNM0983]
MIVVGGVLVLAGLVLSVAMGGESPGGWLLPIGLLAGGAGVLVAGVLALLRRRIAVVRGVARAHRSAPAGGPVRRAAAVPRMVVASARGRNPLLPRYQVLLWLVAGAYLVWPLDFVPDLLPLLGIGDDIGVGAWLLTSLYAEAGNYLAQGVASEEDAAESAGDASRSR